MFSHDIDTRPLDQLTPTGPQQVTVAAGGEWFSLDGDEPIVLRHRNALRRVLSALVHHRTVAPGVALRWRDVFDSGWPNEQVLVRSARTRVRVAIAWLRRAGLREVIQTNEVGYLLDPSERVLVCSSAHEATLPTSSAALRTTSLSGTPSAST
jgi:hypothetical protein